MTDLIDLRVSRKDMVDLLKRREILYKNSNSDCLKGINIIKIITKEYYGEKYFYNKKDIMESIDSSNEIDKKLKKVVKSTIKEWLGFAEQEPTKSSCIII